MPLRKHREDKLRHYAQHYIGQIKESRKLPPGNADAKKQKENADFIDEARERAWLKAGHHLDDLIRIKMVSTLVGLEKIENLNVNTPKTITDLLGAETLHPDRLEVLEKPVRKHYEKLCREEQNRAANEPLNDVVFGKWLQARLFTGKTPEDIKNLFPLMKTVDEGLGKVGDFKNYFFAEPKVGGAPFDSSRLGGTLPEEELLEVSYPEDPGNEGDRSPVEKEHDVTIDLHGAIRHDKGEGNGEDPKAHAYMHAIFDRILWETRGKLEDVNRHLEAYAQAEGKAAVAEARDAYDQAVARYEEFEASFLGGSDVKLHRYGPAFNMIKFYPVVTNEGYIVSVRLECFWKNPYHSNSTVKV